MKSDQTVIVHERQHSPKLEVSGCVVLTVSQLLLPQYPGGMDGFSRKTKKACSKSGTLP